MQTKSFLFVPSIKQERFIKALSSGANHIIIDLEDTVNASQKQEGRDNILNFAMSHNDCFFVRINDSQSPFFDADIALLLELQKIHKLSGIVLPKSQSIKDFDLLQKYFENITIMPIIETTLGLENLDSIAKLPCVKLLSFGALDMALDIGLQEGRGKDFMLNYIRSQIVLKSIKYKLLAPINGVYPDIKNEQGLQEDMEFAASMGFGGSLCIHPNQIKTIHKAFSPSQEQVKWAEEIISLSKNTKEIIFNYNGTMVDLPVIKRAQNILANQ